MASPGHVLVTTQYAQTAKHATATTSEREGGHDSRLGSREPGASHLVFAGVFSPTAGASYRKQVRWPGAEG